MLRELVGAGVEVGVGVVVVAGVVAAAATKAGAAVGVAAATKIWVGCSLPRGFPVSKILHAILLSQMLRSACFQNDIPHLAWCRNQGKTQHYLALGENSSDNTFSASPLLAQSSIVVDCQSIIDEFNPQHKCRFPG